MPFLDTYLGSSFPGTLQLAENFVEDRASLFWFTRQTHSYYEPLPV